MSEQQPDRPLKVFVSGDVNGKFNSLFNRINAVQTKMGQFDMLLCVGNFFGSDMSQWLPYKNGEKVVPVTTYVLGCNKDDDAQHFMDDEGGDLSENVTYLGKSGLFTSTSGLTVAYMSGKDGGDKDDFSHFSSNDVQSLIDKISTAQGFNGVDILLTSVWPKDVSQYGTELKSQPQEESENTARLAIALKPRYHFSGIEGISYERNPYRNHKMLSGQNTHVTRFVALAHVGNKEKLKYLYAFNIVPMKHISKEELHKQPVDTTECPFKSAAAAGSKPTLQDTATMERNTFFYGESPQAGHKRRGGPHGDGAGGKRSTEPPKPKGPCWFCLGSPEVEKHLVVSVGTNVYLALAKGGLTDEHILILPIGHFQSLVTCSEEVIEEIDKYKLALKKFFKSEGKSVVFFERNYKSSHTQVQAVPIPKEKADQCLAVFMQDAERAGIDLVEIPERSDIKEIVQPGKTYFYVELPGGEKLFHRIQKSFPIQFGREVMADEEILNKPEAVDWRNCTVSKDREVEMSKAFKKAFRPFDFNAM